MPLPRTPAVSRRSPSAWWQGARPNGVPTLPYQRWTSSGRAALWHAIRLARETREALAPGAPTPVGKVSGVLVLRAASKEVAEAIAFRALRAARAAHAVDRRGLWQAQTPQMFRLGLLREALAAAGQAVTDEASAIERLGHAPRLVPGALENFKLTWPADFALAERLLRTRQ